MKWRSGRDSENVRFERGGAGPQRPRRGGAQIGGLGLVVVLLLGLFFGVDVTPFLQGSDPGMTTSAGREPTAGEREAESFIVKVVGFTEDAWKPIFQRQLGRAYQPVEVQGYYGQTMSACGPANAATGPFYCPQDQRIYIDPGFFATLQDELGAGGDFAAAYVVAHEVAHHIQDQLGILAKVNAVRQRSTEEASNALSVRIELQADCLSGVWARAVQQRFDALEPGDLEEAINAAEQIGDDVLMRRAGRTPQPHMYTHGTAAQRSRWFGIGYRSGLVEDCDTLNASRL